MNVLVCEDSPTTRQLVTGLLRTEGWSVAEAPDGASALRLLWAGGWDAVVLDLRLPGLDGECVLGAMLPQERSRVVVWTALDPSEARGLVPPGYAALLHKPATPEAILAAVRLAAGGRA